MSADGSRSTDGSQIDAQALATLRDSIGPESLMRVVELYLGELPGRRERVESALAGGDAEALTDAAHTLKSTSATLGAARLAELSERLEHLGRSEDLAAARGLAAEFAAACEAVTARLAQAAAAT